MSTGQSLRAAAPSPGVSQASPDRLTLVAFAAFVILGGGASIAVRYTYSELAPYWGGALRFGVAALILWALALIRKVPLPRGRGLTGAILFGLLSTGLAFIFIYYGLVKTPASLYQTTVAIVPLLTLLFARLHGLEKLHLRGVLGALFSVVGIAVALNGSLSAGVDVSLPHILAIIAGAACFAEAGVVAKLFPRSHPIATNAVAMTAGGVVMVAASLLAGEPKSLPTSLNIWLAIAYLILGLTVVGFLLYLFVLGRWTASGASYSFVIIPIVTVILAAVLAGETITPVFLGGGVLVLIGVWIGAVQLPHAPAERPAEDLQVRPGLPSCG